MYMRLTIPVGYGDIYLNLAYRHSKRLLFGIRLFSYVSLKLFEALIPAEISVNAGNPCESTKGPASRTYISAW